jgi:hypothetical protein
LDLAKTEAQPPLTEDGLKRDFQQWELQERCAANGIAGLPQGTGEARPRSLTPEAAARFMRAMRGETICGLCEERPK